MNQISVVAIRAIMGAWSSINQDRTLYARKGREGEMAYPEDKVRPLSMGRPRLILATTLFSRWRQHVLSDKNTMFMVSFGRFYSYRLTDDAAEGQGNTDAGG